MTSNDAEALAGLKALIAAIVRDELARRGPANDELLTPLEAARHAKISPATVRRWIRTGKLRGHHAGRHVRVRRVDLDELLRLGPRDASGLTPEQMALRDMG